MRNAERILLRPVALTDGNSFHRLLMPGDCETLSMLTVRFDSCNIKPKVYKSIFCLACLFTVLETSSFAQRTHRPLTARPQHIRTRVAADPTLGPGAFVARPVNTTDELIGQIVHSSTVRKRYAGHFGIPEDKVVRFVKNALVLSRLPQARTVSNYYVTRSGKISSRRETLPAGAKVWATRSGLPVLKWVCANPLTKRLPGATPGQVLSQEPSRSAQVDDLASETPSSTEDLLSSPSNEADLPDKPTLQASASIDLPSSALVESPVPLSTAPNLALARGGGLGFGSLLPLARIGAGGLALSPLLIPLLSSGSGNGGGSNAFTGGSDGGGQNGILPGGQNTIAAPEPASVCLMGVAPTLLGLLRRRKR